MIYFLIFLLGILYGLLGFGVVAWIDTRTNGRGLAWIPKLILAECAALVLWPLLLVAHGLDRMLDQVLALFVRARS